MFFTLILENSSGDRINMTTTANQYMTSKISGLHPPPGTISTSSYAGIDGSYLNNALDNIEIRNDGDETGFIIQIETMTDVTVPEIAAVTPTIYNADMGEYLQIKEEILRGDIITISTKTGNKTVTLTRNSVDSNIINRLVSGSTWLTLREGLNTFHVQAVHNVKNLKITLMHTNSFLGV